MAQWIRHRSTEPEIVGSSPTRVNFFACSWHLLSSFVCVSYGQGSLYTAGISGLVVEYIVAIDVTRVRFPADAFILPEVGSYVAKTFSKTHSFSRLSDVV